jgi:hypothetical protein
VSSNIDENLNQPHWTDTTARTLDAAVGLLALYEDIQEEVHDEIQAVISTSGKVVSICRDKVDQAATK